MNSITAAKNRRVNPPQTAASSLPPQNTYINKNAQNITDPPAPPTNKGMNSSLTLPQVIQLVDIRLTNLEKTVIEIKSNPTTIVPTLSNDNKNISNNVEINYPMELKETIEEFDKRYEMLAQEIIELKNIVLRLQTYTMDVNKMLMEERTQIIEELEKKQEEQSDS